MKSMLSDLRLDPKDRDFSWDGELVYTTEYGDNLRTALVAALGVIDAENDYDEFAKSRGGIQASKRLLGATRELETALEPFRKEQK
jgi:hypothetical protein